MKTPLPKLIRYRPEIRFADIDSYGIVHNANFLLYFEQSRICLFKEIAGDWDWTINGVLVARQEVDYRRPVKLGDEIEITIWIHELGEKSITCAYEAHIINNEKRILCTESKTVIVCYSSLKRETTTVPVEWREAIVNNGLLGRPESL
jgi:acyl-CoA thioester hydrolase